MGRLVRELLLGLIRPVIVAGNFVGAAALAVASVQSWTTPAAWLGALLPTWAAATIVYGFLAVGTLAIAVTGVVVTMVAIRETERYLAEKFP